VLDSLWCSIMLRGVVWRGFGNGIAFLAVAHHDEQGVALEASAEAPINDTTSSSSSSRYDMPLTCQAQ
jgi:hypothetical protein